MKNKFLKRVFLSVCILMTLALTGCEENEQANIQEPQKTVTAFEESYNVIKEYGFSKGYSRLAFILDSSSLVETDEYYELKATFKKPMVVSKTLEEGSVYTLVSDEFTKKTIDLTYKGNNIFTWGEGEDSIDCVAREEEGVDGFMLYCYSDDRMEAPFYEGVLRVAKDAVTGAQIENKPYITITKEDLSDNSNTLYFNGVEFAENGYVKTLIFIGD